MQPANLIGARMPRREDPRFVRGKGTYLDDLMLPGVLTLALVRSPYAHANISGIDLVEAQQVTGVHRVITATDLGAVNKPLMMMVSAPAPGNGAMQRPLAWEKVCYQGEPVAAVLADDRYIAEDGVQAVVVTYESLPVVSEVRRALDPGAPLLHPGSNDNTLGSWQMAVGDADAAFAGADLVVQTEVEIGRTAGHPIETRGVLASYDPVQDLLTVYSSTQVPHRIRTGLSLALDRPEESIRVVVPDVGGAFGSKLCVYPEEVLCAYLAIQSGRPVKWTEDRREHFMTTAHGRGQVHQIELALTRDGTILGLRDRFLHDNGAYATYGLRVPLVTSKALMGPYRIPNYAVSFTSVFTNKAPVIPYRGAGQPEAVFAIERALDRAAQQLGMEPVELRRRNLIPPEAFPYDTGLVYPGLGPVVYDSGNYPAGLQALCDAVDLAGFRERQAEARQAGRHLGIGFGLYVEETGTGAFESATVRVDFSGTVSITSGLTAQGQGHETMLSQICAEVLGIDMQTIRFHLGDTALSPYGVGTWGSRAAAVAGSAVHEAARQVKEKAVRVAAHLLQVPAEQVRYEGGIAYAAGQPDRRLSLAQLAVAAAPGRGQLPLPEGPGLEATHHFAPKGITYSSGAHACIVSVDIRTCAVSIERYVVVHDCGRVINPAIVDGQTIGGVAQGVGGALYEQLVYDGSGQLITGSFMDYLLPTATEVPHAVEIHHMQTLSPLNPNGVKGAGEGGVIPASAAIVAAVEDALSPLGAEISTTPVTPEMLYAILSGGEVAQ